MVEIDPVPTSYAHNMEDDAGRPLSVRPGSRPDKHHLQDDGPRQHGAPREPIFGPGAGPLIAELIVAIVALGLLLLVLLMAGSIKEKASGLMYGSSPGTQRSESGK